jgi:hypothetical protein
MMRLAAFGTMKEGVAKQFAIFRNKHTWAMTILYIVTFGSFIGFSMALPLSMKVIFGVSAPARRQRRHAAHAAQPERAAGAGLCLDRPLRRRPDPAGGRLDLRQGRRLDRHAMGLRGDGRGLGRGRLRDDEGLPLGDAGGVFLPLPGLFILLFAASGIGNGSTFRSIGIIFDRQQAGPVLGWTSAVAAYGAFIAPVVIGQQIKLGTPEMAMYGFAVFYALCLVLNWWFYLRAERVREEPLTSFQGQTHEPLPRPTHPFFLAQGELLGRPSAAPPVKTGPGKTAIATAGSTTRSCAAPTAPTAPVRAAGRSTSRAASSPGRRSRPTTRARAPTCPTTSRAAARAAPATAGTCTAPTA